MAAYAALVSLINDLELIPIHPRHSFSFENKQIASLSQTVHFLIAFLESYDALGRSAKVLESRIASAAHAADDVIESHVVDQIHAGATLLRKPRSYFLIDLHKAIENMNFVKRKAMQFERKGRKKAELRTYSPSTSSAPQTLRKNKMVGFDAVSGRLMEILVGEASSQVVIPIVGMGGIGKTTLAKYAYEHSLVEHHFDARHWATISQEYTAETILTQLLFGERKSTGRNVNELGNELRKKLWGRRYLIILDDMWSVEAWDEIHMYLPHNSNRSRVIVTTRLSNLANNLSSSPFKMEFLDKNESWKLFCGKAFDEQECPPELEEIGKRIVGKCQGLPLSIVVIGGHLRNSSRAIECWEKVANLMNPIWSSDEGENCMQIIRLSYEQLPVYLKPCFLYMGKLAEDAWIYLSFLVRRWVAEGFLRAKEGLSLEEVAEDYLNGLIDRNLIIVRERRWNGKPKVIGIHDIVRELCMKVCKKEKFVCVVDKTQDISSERRIVIPEGKQESDIVNAVKSSSPLLRSLTVEWIHYLRLSEKLPLELVKLLRIADGGCSLAADFQPVNLRYLAWHSLLDENISHLARWSMSLFWNLQTLTMISHGRGITAPQEIWEMTLLRHVVFAKLKLPRPIRNEQRECTVLRNLQTLNGVRNLRLTEEVCQRIPNVKDLKVSYDWSGFTKLESLNLYGHGFVQCFAFPRSLQELDLDGSSLCWGDVGVVIGSLPHLGFLRLSFVRGDEWSLVDDEEFPCLKSLTISSCGDLVYWNANSSHFPMLERLEIMGLHKLSEIPFGIGDIPTLEHILVVNCSLSAAVSAMRILVELQSLENYDLQLHVQFDEMKEVERFQKLVQEDLNCNSLRLFCKDEKIKAY